MKTPWTVFLGLLGCTAIMSLWILIAEHWPASMLIAIQRTAFAGNYSPTLTFFIVWVMVFLGSAAVVLLGENVWSRIWRRR